MSIFNPAGMPVRMAVSPGPWLSPAVVSWSRRIADAAYQESLSTAGRASSWKGRLRGSGVRHRRPLSVE